MRRLTCVIIDDESIAKNAMQGYVEKVDELQLVHSFSNGLAAKDWLGVNEVDLLFLDINMPFLNGLELLRLLKKEPSVIFTTAYTEHALESYEFNAIDYLVKPISFERFLQSVNKALRFMERRLAGEEKFLILKEGSAIIKIKTSEILYVEAMQNYVKVHLDGRTHTILMTMKELLQQLPNEEFSQTHRSFIVHLNKVTEVSGDLIRVGAIQIPLSKRSKTLFLEKFKSF